MSARLHRFEVASTPVVADARFFGVSENPTPSAGAHVSRFVPQIGLLALLIAELLYVTITFDTQRLDQVPAAWARLLGWTPEYLRLAITTFVVTLLVNGREIGSVLRTTKADAVRIRLHTLVIHMMAFVVFTRITGIVMGKDFPAASHQGTWALAWAFAGTTTLATWGLSASGLETWRSIARVSGNGILWGLGAGAAAWTGGFFTQEFWKPLARYTFSVVAWTLRWFYADAISDPAGFVLGTPRFSVNIAPACSGYEGIGLILAFLSIYLWLLRRELRFPRAFILLPLGAAAIWLLNAARIAALIVIGTAGWPAVALGGFHSQVGWLSFNAVGLGFVALTMRGRYFMATASTITETREASALARSADPTAAYLAPFLAIVATTMVTGAFSAGFDWLYPARVLAAGAALWSFRHNYADLRWKWSWSAIAIGVVAFLIWVMLMPADANDKDNWPSALGAIPSGWATAWLVIRVVGYVVTVPAAEELAFRGFLPRRLVQADFYRLPVANLRWIPLLISSFLFGALHGQFWLAGTITGMLFGVALYRGKALGDAVQAHATTNGLIVLYVFATGHWSAWS